MFFFAANEGAVDRNRLRSTLGWSGEIRMLRKDATLLLWTEDDFTRFWKKGALVRVTVGGSRSDGQAVCTFEWNLGSDTVTVRRRWSGEFTAYVAREPTCAIASHLRLISGAFGGRPPGTQRVKPGWSVLMNSSNQFLSEWVRAVNGHGGFGTWAADVSRYPSDIHEILQRQGALAI
jgi:hypothetical protein